MSTVAAANVADASVNVRVSSKKRKYLYVDYTKHRLHEGAAEIVISGLGSAITDAVSVAEMLKNKGLVEVRKIRTSRGDVEAARTSYVDKIEITVVKSSKFDQLYEEMEKAKAAGRRDDHEGEEEEDEQ